MISDVLSNAVDDIREYLNKPVFRNAYEGKLREWIERVVRDMGALRAALDRPPGEEPLADPSELLDEACEAVAEAMNAVDGAYRATGYVKVAKTSVQRLRLEGILTRLATGGAPAPERRMQPIDLLRRGGKWLGAARQWLQWNKRNGDVTWGSTDAIEPPMTAGDVDDLAAHVAAELWPVGAPPAVLEAAKKIARWHYGRGQGDYAEPDCVLVAREDWLALQKAVSEAPQTPSNTEVIEAVLRTWNMIRSLIASGTPVEGLDTIAKGNVEALEARIGAPANSEQEWGTMSAYRADLVREMCYSHWSDEQRKVLRLALKWFDEARASIVP